MRIPMLAIHLNRDISTKGFELNKQTHLVPVLASAVKQAANKAASNGNSVEANGNNVEASGQNKRQKVDGAGDAADLTPKTARVSFSSPLYWSIELEVLPSFQIEQEAQAYDSPPTQLTSMYVIEYAKH